MSTRKTLCILTVIVAMTVIIVGCANAFSIWQFSFTDETHSADCAIVAGASVQGDKPSPVFQERLNHAVNLYRDGYVKTLIVTGGYRADNALSDAAVARRYLLSQNIPDRVILVEDRSGVTRENLRFARNVMLINHLQTALMVSDPLQMKRIMLIAKDEGIDAWASPTPTTRYRSFSARMAFLLHETLWYSVYPLYRAL